MSDDIDIGITVRASDADIASVDRAGQSIKAFTITVEQSREIMARVGGDFEKYKQELLKLKEAHDAAAAGARSMGGAERQATAAFQQTGQAAQGAGEKIQLFGNAADAGFQRVPRGARTAANALQQIAISAETGRGGLDGMLRSAGSLAFGMSQLSSNAKVVASAAGIGALVTIGATIIEVFEHMDDEFDKSRAHVTNFAQFSAAQLEILQAAQRRFRDEQERLARQSVAPPSLGEAVRQSTQLKNLINPFFEFNKVLEEVGLKASPAQIAFQNATKNVEEAQKELIAKTRAANQEFEDEQRKTLGDLNEINAKAARDDAQAKRIAADNELADQKAQLARRKLAVDDAAKAAPGNTAADRAARESLRVLAAQIQTEELNDTAVHNAKINQINRDQADAERKLRQDQARQLAAIDDKSTQGELAKRRQAADAALDVEVTAINDRADVSRPAKDQAIEQAHAQHAKAIHAIDVDEALASKKVVEDATAEILAAETRSNDDRIGAEIAAAQKRIDVVTDELKQKGVKGDAYLRARMAALLAFNADVSAVTKKENDDLDKAVADSRARTLELQGKPAAAEQARIATDTATLIARLQAAGTRGRTSSTADIDAIRRQGDLATAAAKVKEIEQSVTDALDHEQARLNEIHGLVATHAITERQARLDIVDAETKARDAIAASIPLLQAQADKLQDAKSADQVLALKTRLLELNLAISESSDDLFKLKEAGIDAATSALAGIFEGATKLGTQSHAEIASLKTEIASAQDELTTLLDRPNRSTADNQRITQLRGEIQQTTVALDNAKASITTWKDLFVNAARSIVDALIKVSSQMLATAAIERILSFFRGVDASAAMDDILSQGIPGVQFAAPHAAGGPIRGPGTSTSDSILTPTSDGEYVIRAERVRQFGESFFNRINYDGEIPAIRRRPYRDGGLVTPDGAGDGLRRSRGAGSAAALGAAVHHFRFTVPKGFTLEHIRSPEGHTAVVEVISERSNAVNAALGR